MIKQLSLVIVGGVCVAAGVVAGTRGQAPAPPAAPATTFLVKDARVFDGETVHERASVLVRDGNIAAIGPDIAAPAGARIVDGAGRTLLPGFIDAHTHVFGNALERALVFGVTTELDMFTSHEFAAQMRAEQRGPGAAARADIVSAGTLVTAPRGHGTQFGMPIPTIQSAAEAQAFVDARIAEGSDYIKVVYEDGTAHGLSLPGIGRDVLDAVVAAAHARGTLAVVHVSTRAGADHAIAAGADGLVHLFADAPPAADFAARARAARMFVTPTLTVIESTGGQAGGAALAAAASLAPFLAAAEKTALAGAFPVRPGSKVNLQHALDATRLLHAAGVPILAGTDAPNPGTAHGVSMHRELELLVRAGLPPAAALASATSVPARAYRLADRGRIAPGLRADLVLVTGDATRDILATRAIVDVWKGGARLERRHAPTGTEAAKAVTSGAISDFDGELPAAAFGAGWQISTDTMMGGASEARMLIARPGASGSAGALEVNGAIKGTAPYPWAGAMFFPADTPMTPANLSAFKELVFFAKGDGRDYQVMLFATRLGNIPAARPFSAGPEWHEHVIPLRAFSDIDGSDVRGIMFSATGAPGPFRFAIDQVRLR